MQRLDDDELRRWLREDAPFGDLTTHALGIGASAAHIDFSARRAMRVAATEEAARLLELCGASVQLQLSSGCDAAPGQALLQATGPADGLLLAWKVAQTAVEAASGLATEAARIVAALRDAGFGVPLACTRKTWPVGRALAVRAVRAGGAVMHRLGLSETLLVFPEHAALLPAGQLPQRLAQVRGTQPEKKLVIEVGSAEQAVQAARHGVDVLQLERFSPDDLAALRRQLDDLGLRPLLAPAGGVTLANAVAYARAGADLLVSSAPYFAPPADVKVTISPLAPPTG